MTEYSIGMVGVFNEKPIQAIEIGEKKLVVVKTDEGFFCLEDRCSHADVKLSKGSIEEGELLCPAHGARFDLATGAPRCLPAVTPVKTYPIVERSGELFVTIG